MEVFRRCARCKEEKPLSSFGLVRNKPKCYCRPCEATYAREWAARNKENINLKRRKALRERVRYDRCRKERACFDCGAETSGAAYCNEHQKIRAEREVLRRLAKPPRICRGCGSVTAPFGRSLCDKCSDTKGSRWRRYQSVWREQQTLETFDHYGGRQCACCGESNTVFLTIDHVNNDGSQHRKQIKSEGVARIYTWLKKHGYPPGFRVLCYNCNCGKYRNGGKCPHEDQRAVAQ